MLEDCGLLGYGVFGLILTDAASVVLSDCTAWKNHVNAMIPGGFDSRKHPIYISDAIVNAQRYFRTTGEELLYGSTKMFKLGKTLYPMIASAVERARRISSL